MFNNGIGVAKDEVEAAKFYGQAAAQGVHESQFSLGVMYEYGRGCLIKDIKKAINLYRNSATYGNNEAKKKLIELCKDDNSDTMACYSIWNRFR
jgi:TPR repeat protein